MNWFNQLSERMFPNHADKYGETHLHLAATKGDGARVVELLDRGADPNAKDQWGRTPLHKAAGSGSVPCVEALLSKHANVSEPDKNGTQPIHYACKSGHADTVQTLLRHGASTKASGENGRGCIHFAALGDGTSVMDRLLQEGQQIDERDGTGFTPLALACTERNSAAVQYLLMHGANPNVLCGAGYAPLTISVMKADANEEIIMALLNFGADPQLGKPDQPISNAVAAAAMLAASAETESGITGMIFSLKRRANPSDPALSLHRRLIPILAEGVRVPPRQVAHGKNSVVPSSPDAAGQSPIGAMQISGKVDSNPSLGYEVLSMQLVATRQQLEKVRSVGIEDAVVAEGPANGGTLKTTMEFLMRDECSVKDFMFTERSDAVHYVQLLAIGIDKVNQAINCRG